MGKVKSLITTCAVAIIVTGNQIVFADTAGVVNPLAGKSGNAGSMLNKLLSYLDDAIFAIGGAWFLFSLYMSIIKFMSHSHQAQRREEAKTHLWHVAIAGVMLGAGGALAAALYNFGSSL